jgi:very-short-patch-repair endonuclease
VGYQIDHLPRADHLWALVERQHGVVTRAQLLEHGFPAKAIKHRVANGRLHPLSRGVYAVGRPQVTRRGRWMAAVLSCGRQAVLSHGSAAALWEMASDRYGRIEVSVHKRSPHRRAGLVVHRRAGLTVEDVTRHEGIPVTTPVCTLVDLAPRLGSRRLEKAIKEADVRGLVDPDTLRAALGEMRGRRGVAILRETLDRRTFTLTDSELERRFLPIAREAGLPLPHTQHTVNGFRVDFFWPELGLVVETDGLRYHRTPAQQAMDRVRDQAHTASGLTPLRFTHAQIRYEPRHVKATLTAIAERLRSPKPIE